MDAHEILSKIPPTDFDEAIKIIVCNKLVICDSSKTLETFSEVVHNLAVRIAKKSTPKLQMVSPDLIRMCSEIILVLIIQRAEYGMDVIEGMKMVDKGWMN